MANPLVLIAGGGTGGHVFPALAVAKKLKRRGAQIEFVGTDRGFEARLVPERGYVLHTLPVRGLSGKRMLDRLRGLVILPVAIVRAWLLLRRLRPDVVLGVGGYASGPAVVAAWLRRIPVAIHEQNAVPGNANKIGSKFAKLVAVSYPSSSEAFEGEVVVTGNPVREAFFETPPVEPEDPIRILIFGGSQGSRILNLRMTEALPFLTGVRIGIVHQTGQLDCDRIRQLYASTPFRGAVVIPFVDDMPREIAAADLIIARAGATSVAELAASGRPSILVPFAAATGGHQELNARAMEENGAAVVLLENELTGESLAACITELARAPERLIRMGAKARDLARPNAADRLADLLLGLIPGNESED